MSSRRVKILTDLDVAKAAAQSHAAPSTDEHGVSLATWKRGGYSPDACVVRLGPSVGGAVAIDAGAYVAGYLASTDEWYRIADLNAGEAIALTETMGYAQRLIDVGGFDRLAVIDTGDAETHPYGFTPTEALE
jgi:hypothetical protein